MSPSNPVTVKILEDLGASTVNIPADVTLAELAEMRAAARLPLDLYVEFPDPLGGVVRGQEPPHSPAAPNAKTVTGQSYLAAPGR
jgi:hypothetical protein